MNNLFKKKPTAIDKEIEKVELSLSVVEDKSSEEYKELLRTLSDLKKLQNGKDSDRKKLDPNTLVVAGGSMLELLMIMNYERIHVISTKAFGRILKGRV